MYLHEVFHGISTSFNDIKKNILIHFLSFQTYTATAILQVSDLNWSPLGEKHRHVSNLEDENMELLGPKRAANQ